MSSQQSKNHHWFPQCLMRPWAGRDNRVESFSIQPWGLSVRRQSTKSIGSEDFLHKIDLLEEPNRVEAIFSAIETDFSEARRKALDEGIPALSQDDRQNFAFLVAMLANRRSEKIKIATIAAADEFSRSFSNKLSAMDPIEAERVTKGLGTYVALRALMEFAAGLCPNIASLEWRIIDFSRITLKLVLADRPLLAWTEDAKITRVTLPLGPDHLFVAGKFPASEEIIFDEKFREVLAVKIVGQQFRQASNFVVACTRDPYFDLAESILKAPNQIPPKGTW